jgi:hypothetical protein
MLHIFRQAFIIYGKNNLGGLYMSKRRRSNNISDELIELLEELLEELSNNRNDNRRDDRLEDGRSNIMGNNINPDNDWCPGCSNDSFCLNNNDDDDDRFDNSNGCNRRNRRNRGNRVR